MVLQTDGDVMQIIPTLGTTSCFAGRLNSGQQQSYQDTDDRNDDQQFHERKTAPNRSSSHGTSLDKRVTKKRE
jgi:hypothetical protein